jgi:NADH-quinone oxidoreductase subunit F
MIERLGVKIHLNKRLGKDIHLKELHEKGYEAVFLGVGCPEGSALGLPGDKAQGVTESLSYLKEFNLHGQVKTGKNVVVIGGGNAAIDAARTAKRLGAEKVTIVYRRARAQMPAWEEEIHAALDEHIALETLVAPVEILSREGHVVGLKCKRQILGDYDRSGRRAPVAGSSPDYVIDCDQVIAAIGQNTTFAPLLKDLTIKTNKWGQPTYDKQTGATSVPWLFIGGDAALGAASVVEAVSGGERAAVSIDRLLSGENHAFWRRVRPVNTAFDPDAEPVMTQRATIPCLTAHERVKGFAEVEQSWTSPTALKEARRCLRCDFGKPCDTTQSHS